MGTVILNGTTYNDSDFLGYGYVSRFPAQVFSDMIAEMNYRMSAVISALGIAGLIQTKTGTYNMLPGDQVVFMDCGLGDGILNLFSLSTLPTDAMVIVVSMINSDTNTVTVNPNGAETINETAGPQTITMRNETLRLVRQSATNWQVI